MKLAIDKNVPIPAYQQVVDGIAEAIARGDITGGARLPSVRALAVDLGLNVNTVARAYRDLERAGVIATRPGMGTFVAPPSGARSTGYAGRHGGGWRPIPATGGPADGLALTGPIPSSWRAMLEAAHALAAAEGVAEEEFLAGAALAARSAADTNTLLVAAGSQGEASDIVKSLPQQVAALASVVDLDDLAERAASGAAAVVTTFPLQARVRAILAGQPGVVTVIPVESEYTEPTLRALSALPALGRIALVTAEKAHWDHEANDVMKVIGRSRWLKMVLLENGERGLGDRLENIDVILHVPRAREAVTVVARPGMAVVELVRQVTPRTRERLLQVVEPPA